MARRKVLYGVRSGFMAFQFDKKGTFCIGLDCNSINTGSEYEITIGKNDETKYYLTREEVERLMEKYGKDKIIRTRGYKQLYIVPVNEMRRKNSYDKLFDF